MSPRRCLAAAFAAATIAPAPAFAHGEGALADRVAKGRYVTELERPPHVDGLTVTVGEGRVPALYVHNRTGHTLTIHDAAGRGFLRIGPGGVRRRSAHGWRRLSAAPRWAWLEPRGRVPAHGLGARAATAARWTTVMTLGNRTLRIGGRVRWVPTARPHRHPVRASAADLRSAGGSSAHHPVEAPALMALSLALIAGITGYVLRALLLPLVAPPTRQHGLFAWQPAPKGGARGRSRSPR